MICNVEIPNGRTDCRLQSLDYRNWIYLLGFYTLFYSLDSITNILDTLNFDTNGFLISGCETPQFSLLCNMKFIFTA